MASLVLCKVCLFLLLTIVVALPVAVPRKKLLLRPYLKLPGRGDSTGNVPGTKSDITTVLNELGCDYDNMLTLFYSSKGVGFLPEFRAPTPAFVHLYNGNIELLWMINNQMWLKDMCEEGVLADLSSLPFCSNLDTEDALEKGFISSMSSTLSTLELTDIIQFASDLQKLKGKEECMHVCGDKFKSVLCSAFTELSTFLMNQVIKPDTRSFGLAEVAHSVVSGGSAQGTTVLAPGLQPDTFEPGHTKPSVPNSGALKTDDNQLTSTTSLATKLSITDDPVAVKAFIDKYLQENIDPQILSRFFSVTSPTDNKQTSSQTIPTVAKDIAHAGNGNVDSSMDTAPTTDTEIPATSSNATSVTEPPGLDDDDDGNGLGGGNNLSPSQQGDQSQQEDGGGESEANEQELPTTEAKADSLGEGEGDYDDDESGGSGYSSIHFFSIILVLVVFTATAYLCVYHKKKIKETMKGYVSDGQKRRARGSYKPLLSGKK
ncbi:hypothetical protein GBAR_LOCUS28660 [Geodia barretti]|uniref:Uncharacterized protein n=1 Tax=Geodia barretti TaxID=519541 RepID=A0AA35XBB2_GEOBA|nr:hypothetical protein GBAR_LOCUS28660 [Geodia barretti]